MLPLLRYRDYDDVVRRANNTEYGLAASVWGRDVALAEQLASRLEAGTVWINQVHVFSPGIAFGGHTQSGVGIENSLHGLAEYCNSQTLMRKPLWSQAETEPGARRTAKSKGVSRPWGCGRRPHRTEADGVDRR